MEPIANRNVWNFLCKPIIIFKMPVSDWPITIFGLFFSVKISHSGFDDKEVKSLFCIWAVFSAHSYVGKMKPQQGFLVSRPWFLRGSLLNRVDNKLPTHIKPHS